MQISSHNSSSFRFPHQNPVGISLLRNSATCPAHFILFVTIKCLVRSKNGEVIQNAVFAILLLLHCSYARGFSSAL